MSFFVPAALGLGLLALPIILLYMLRLRRREQPISSVLLWRELLHDRAANAPWQRLRRNLLLLLQLIALAAFVLALARPALRVPGLSGGNVVVLLDASASMQATDGERGSRFTDATVEIGQLVDNLGGSDQMTLIRVGQTPHVLAAATNDRDLLRRALASAAPENGSADWPAAFALAGSSVSGLGRPRFVILSDGSLPDGLPALPGDVSFVPVGRSGDNLAVTALAARPTPAGDQVLVVATNPGPTPRSALLSLLIDDVIYDSRRLDLAPGEQVSQNWSVPPGAAFIEAHLEPRDGVADHLTLDDRAWTMSTAGDTQRVLLIGDGNLFLERLFAVLPGYELFHATAAEAVTAVDGGDIYDLYVYDGEALPDGPLPGNTLVFNPQPAGAGGDPLLTVTGTFTDTVAVQVADDPLLENVDWRAISVAAAQRVTAPSLEPLVEAEGGPLLLAGEQDRRRVAVFTFDLRASDLPLQIAFPVIMANIVEWLSPGHVIANENLQPGASVMLQPAARDAAVSVTLPDGTIWEQPGDLAGEPALFSQTQQLGVYRVASREPSGPWQPAGAFAVNFLNGEESRIQPAAKLLVGAAEITPGTQGLEGLREFWPWLLSAGLFVLFAEWWVTYRRGLGRALSSWR